MTPAHANDVSISYSVNGNPLAVSASADRFAGAIVSLTFRGVQYVDIYDHGREIQSAIQLDNLGECYNPNEAGSETDGTGQTTTSILHLISNTNNVLQTQTQPAFWLPKNYNYNKPCNPNLPYPDNIISTAQNTNDLSNYTIARTTSFFGPSIPNLLNVQTSFTVPENHNSSNAEALTAYLPSSFSTFLQYDRASRTLIKVAAGGVDTPSQHTPRPVIIAQPNGAHAMGVISPAIIANPSVGYIAYIKYGGQAATSKWSCVFGETNIIAGSTYTYSCPLAVGNVDEVVDAFNAYPVPGQTITTMIPIYRFYGYQKHFMTPSYAEGASTGYVFETTGFHLFPAADSGLKALYRCNNAIYNDHFVSTQSNCEGFTQEGIYGYASISEYPGSYPLYRFYRGTTRDHLITINYSEGASGGYLYEGILGYVTS